jgi:hypothetical protein
VSARTFCFVGFKALIIVLATAAMIAAPTQGSSTPNAIQLENQRPGTTAWAAPIANPLIEGYPSTTSVAPGDQLSLHVSVRASEPYRIEVYRLGWYGGAGGRLMTCVPSCTGTEKGIEQPSPTVEPSTGRAAANWPVTDTIAVDAAWVSGYYVAKLVRAPPGAPVAASDVPFIVRQDAKPSEALVVVPVNTWEAYNPWGGKSVYGVNSTNGVPAVEVSFDRPLAVDRPGYAAAQNSFLNWELPLVRFLESEGVDVSYETDVDVDEAPASLLQHRLVLVAGHSEYWTSGIRQAYETALAHGTNLAFMGANDGYWRVRYADERRTMVAYKEQAASDPEAKELTTLFRLLSPASPECAVLGGEHQPPGGRPTATAPEPTIVPAPEALNDSWFSGTGFNATSLVRGLLGYEWDAPVPGCPSSPTWRALFTGGPDAPSAFAASRWTAPSGATVFNAGTLQFAWGLDDGGHGKVDPRLQRFVLNMLGDLTRPATTTLRVAATTRGVSIGISDSNPRLRAIIYLRGQRSSTGIQWQPVSSCGQRMPSCLDLAPGHREYVYGVELTDTWSTSPPIVSDRVDVPNTAPKLTLVARVRDGLRQIVALTHDRDHDTVHVQWRVAGKKRLQGNRISLQLSGSKRVIVVATATDGHGGVTQRRVTVRA